VHTAIRWLDVLFGAGDTDHPFWLLTVRINILLFIVCAAVVVAWNLSPCRLRRAWEVKTEVCAVVLLTVLAGVLRLVIARTNLMDHGGIAYSRLLLGYKGYFGTAQVFSLFYRLTARDIEHAIFCNRIAGTLTIPLVYIFCRNLAPAAKFFPVTAAFLLAIYPLHILFSASDALAIFSGSLAAASFALLSGASDKRESRAVARVRDLGGFAGLALLTQVRYENVLLLVIPAIILLARRHSARFLPLVPVLVVPAIFTGIYGYEAVTSGLTYQKLVNRWESWNTVEWQLVLNPFVAVPVLFIGTVAVRAYKGLGLGDLALLPWLGAFVLTVLTIDSGHSAARVYANWLILILPLVAYGFSLMLSAPGWLAKAIAALALLALGAQPMLMRDRLETQYLEILENDRFKSWLAIPHPGAISLIVPDDELLRRQAHSTLEVFNKYVMIRAASADAARLPRLVELTEYLEHPQETSCTHGACLFFFGLPCTEGKMYPLASEQCQELLRRHRTSVLEETTVVAAPFAKCSIYTGALWKQLCDPAIKPRRFALYRIDE
jgi:hypothetical protein